MQALRRLLFPLFLIVLAPEASHAKGLAKGLDDLQAIIFDMDGVLRVGEEPVDGAGELVSFMQEQNMLGMILTNECRYTPEQIRSDLHKMNIKLPKSWPIYTAALAVRDFLKDRYQYPKRLYSYVIGEAGLHSAIKELETERFVICEQFPQERGPSDQLMLIVGAVNKIRIEDLEQAFTWIRKGAKVLMTCPDQADPAAKGTELVGMPGHLVHMIGHQAPCKPYSLGKPHPFMIAKAIELLQAQLPQLTREHMLFVGDSFDTDIRIAFEAQIPSALVLTGNARFESVDKQVCQPDYVFSSPSGLLQRFERLAAKQRLGKSLQLSAGG